MVDGSSADIIAGLEKSLRELYAEMDKDPTASIPWAVHKHIEHVEKTVREHGSPNGVAKLLPEEPLGAKTDPASPDGWEPATKTSRLLYYVSRHPNPKKEDVLGYVGGTMQQLYSVIAAARNCRYISDKKGEFELTDLGIAHLEKIRKGKPKTPETAGREKPAAGSDLRASLGAYLAERAGEGELDYGEIRVHFPGYGNNKVGTMISLFKSGGMSMPGYRASGSRGKIVVEKTGEWKPDGQRVLKYSGHQ